MLSTIERQIETLYSLLDADDTLLSESLLDDRVLGEGDSLLEDLTVTSLVDEASDGRQVGLSVGHVGLDESEHLLGSLGHLDEHSVVDLEESEQLQDLSRLGGDLVDSKQNPKQSEGGQYQLDGQYNE